MDVEYYTPNTVIETHDEEAQKDHDEAYELFFKDACESYLQALQKTYPNEGFHFRQHFTGNYIEFRNSDFTILSDYTWTKLYDSIMAFYIGLRYKLKDKRSV